MAKTFTFELTAAPEALFAKAVDAAAKYGVTFRGDTDAGTFDGHGVEGHYTADGCVITVTIERKPFFASWAVVESRLRVIFT